MLRLLLRSSQRRAQLRALLCVFLLLSASVTCRRLVRLRPMVSTGCYGALASYALSPGSYPCEGGQSFKTFGGLRKGRSAA